MAARRASAQPGPAQQLFLSCYTGLAAATASGHSGNCGQHRDRGRYPHGVCKAMRSSMGGLLGLGPQ
jgi:hypothetical protein